MLQRELGRRERTMRVLERQRDRLLAQLDQVEAEIRDLGGGSGVRRREGRPDIGRKRPRNEMQLVDVLAKVLDGKTMSVTEAMEAVQGRATGPAQQTSA